MSPPGPGSEAWGRLPDSGTGCERDRPGPAPPSVSRQACWEERTGLLWPSVDPAGRVGFWQNPPWPCPQRLQAWVGRLFSLRAQRRPQPTHSCPARRFLDARSGVTRARTPRSPPQVELGHEKALGPGGAHTHGRRQRCPELILEPGRRQVRWSGRHPQARWWQRQGPGGATFPVLTRNFRVETTATHAWMLRVGQAVPVW